MTAPVNGIAVVGEVLAGKYRVDKILGIGGMGMVVAATHLEIDQRVALKFMLPSTHEVPEASARFLREARAAGRLNSEHVCRVIDVGRFDNGAPYIVMEYLQGENLAVRLRRRGPMRVPDGVDLILQAIEGLAEAHAHGIIHRDLKPDNLFLAKRNDGGAIVKVLDFGISKVAVTGVATGTGDIMGSPAYMAPEQMQSSRDVDQRADVWSLGVVLYQLVTGTLPFHGDSLPLLCMHVVNDAPKPMGAIRGDLPDGFEAAVLRCLCKEPSDRYADVGAMAEALAPFGPKHATTSVSRIQVVLRRVRVGSASTISHEFSTIDPTLDHEQDPQRLPESPVLPQATSTVGSPRLVDRRAGADAGSAGYGSDPEHEDSLPQATSNIRSPGVGDRRAGRDDASAGYGSDHGHEDSLPQDRSNIRSPGVVDRRAGADAGGAGYGSYRLEDSPRQATPNIGSPGVVDRRAGADAGSAGYRSDRRLEDSTAEPGPAALLKVTTLGGTSGQALARHRRGSAARPWRLLGGVGVGIGLVALVAVVAWRSGGAGDAVREVPVAGTPVIAPLAPSAAPAAVAPVPPATSAAPAAVVPVAASVPPAPEASPPRAAGSAGAPAIAVEPGAAPVAEPAARAADVAGTPTPAASLKRKPPRPHRVPGSAARPAAGSGANASAGSGSAAAPNDNNDDKWTHMTHDEAKP